MTAGLAGRLDRYLRYRLHPRRLIETRRVSLAGCARFVLAEMAWLAGMLAAFEWLCPLVQVHTFRPRPLTTWPEDWRLALVALVAAMALWDIARLRPALGKQPALRGATGEAPWLIAALDDGPGQ